MREIVHLQAGQCGNQIGAKVREIFYYRGQSLERARFSGSAIFRIIEHLGFTFFGLQNDSEYIVLWVSRSTNF